MAVSVEKAVMAKRRQLQTILVALGASTIAVSWWNVL